MKVTCLDISDVLLIEPDIFEDDRGFFFESFNKKKFEDFLGSNIDFVQDNHSKSLLGVLRGMHFQSEPHSQGKLVRVINGEIFDVAVDLRKDSKTFGKWVSQILSHSNKKQLWIPQGFAHGFLTLSDKAEVIYKTNRYYNRDSEKCLIWNDDQVGIKWPATYNIKLSEKDLRGIALSDLDI